jgi:hypothetical protein
MEENKTKAVLELFQVQQAKNNLMAQALARLSECLLATTNINIMGLEALLRSKGPEEKEENKVV